VLLLSESDSDSVSPPDSVPLSLSRNGRLRAAAAHVHGLLLPADDEGGLCGTVATAALTPGLGPLLAPPPRGSGRCTVVGVWADLELVGEDESSGATVWCFVLFLRW